MRDMAKMTIIPIIILFIAGCGTKDSTEEVNKSLEQAMESEEAFEAQGKEMNRLESEESALYKEIVATDEEEQEALTDLLKKATTLIEKREDALEKEKSALEDSEEMFHKMDAAIENIKEEEVQKKLGQLVEVMEKRYRTYDDVYDEYKVSLTLTADLYELLKDKSVTPDELYTQAEKVNDSYEEVAHLNENFNNWTDDFNQQKEAYLSLVENTQSK